MKRFKIIVFIPVILSYSLASADGVTAERDERGLQQNSPMALTDPLAAFSCTADQVQPDVKQNLQVLADAVKKVQNPACSSIQKDFGDGVNTQALIQKFTLNPDQATLAQLQSSLTEETAVMGYLQNPSTAPPGFNTSMNTTTATANQIASTQAQIAATETRIGQTNAERNNTTAMQGAATVQQFSDDLSSSITSGCWRTEKTEIASNLAEVAGYFMTGPIGIGVEVGAKILSSITTALEAKKTAQKQQSTQLTLEETEIGLKCYLKQTGKTQCDLLLASTNNSPSCSPTQTIPINTSAQQDLQGLASFLAGMKMDDKGVIADLDSHTSIQSFFAPNSAYKMLTDINTHLLDMKQTLIQSVNSNVDRSNIDIPLLNKYIDQFGALVTNADVLKKKENDNQLDVTVGDEQGFLFQLRKGLHSNNSTALPDLAALDDSFVKLDQQQLMKAGISISSDDLSFYRQNGSSSMKALLTLQAQVQSIPFDKERNNQNANLNYQNMQQMETAYGDKIAKILKQGPSSDAYLQSLDKEGLNYFCMSLLSLPHLGPSKANVTGINFDSGKSPCAGTSITANGKTLSFDAQESQPFSERVCALPLFELGAPQK